MPTYVTHVHTGMSTRMHKYAFTQSHTHRNTHRLLCSVTTSERHLGMLLALIPPGISPTCLGTLQHGKEGGDFPAAVVAGVRLPSVLHNNTIIRSITIFIVITFINRYYDIWQGYSNLTVQSPDYPWFSVLPDN